MKIYIINLKTAEAKKQRIKGLLDEMGCEYEFFEAIDGSRVDTSKFKASPHWMDPYHHTHITEGEIGCALSHFMLWKKIVESDIDRAIILEDDVEFIDGNLMDKCHAINGDYDLVFFVIRRSLKRCWSHLDFYIKGHSLALQGPFPGFPGNGPL